jgi:protein TonB
MPDFRFETIEQMRERVGLESRRWLTVPLSLAAHAMLVSSLVLVPLLSGDALPEHSISSVRAFFVEPSLAPPPPPPPPKSVSVPTKMKSNAKPQETAALTAPAIVPDHVEPDLGSDLGILDGVPEGVEGGVAGGVAGGIVGGLPEVAPPPPPVRIGGAIKEPRKLKHIDPEYPPVALAARIQGVVVLECLISPEGRVTEVKVVNGLPLLSEAAVTAVRQWIYTPTLMNGVPMPALMTLTVRFGLR